MFKLIHKFESPAMKRAGDLICQVANEKAKGDRAVLQSEFLRILEGDAAPAGKFEIIEEDAE